MVEKNKIDKTVKEYSTFEWIKIGVSSIKSIYKTILVGFIMWAIAFIILNYNLPATQKQIDSIQATISTKAQKDSIIAINLVVTFAELNNKISIADLKLSDIKEEQKEQKGILLQLLAETKNVTKTIKGYTYNDSVNTYNTKFIAKTY